LQYNTKNNPENCSQDQRTPSADERSLSDRRIFNTFFSAALSFVFILIVGYFLKYVPNKIDSEFVVKKFFLFFDSFNPEAPERARYIMATFLFPVLFTLIFEIISKSRIKGSVLKVSRYILPTVFICELFVFCFANIINPYIFQYGLLYIHPVFSVLFTALLLAFLYYFQRMHQKSVKIIEAGCFIICLLAAIYVSSIYVTNNYGLNSDAFLNFDAYYYPVFEVFHGKVLSIDFHNIYGFYPYFIAPLLQLTGSITIFKFSVVMAALIFISLASFLAVVWMNIKNKIIALIGYFALLFFAVALPLSIGKQFYLSYQPHRILFPALILLTGSLLLHTPKKSMKNILTVTGYILVCMSLVWNLDTGIVAGGAWCLLLLYMTALDESFKSPKLYKNAAVTIVLAILAVFSSYVIIASITYVRSGIWISASECFYAQNIFYNYGFNMLPMLGLDLWNILILLYVIGLIISLRNMKCLNKGEIPFSRNRSSMYFFVSVIGVGIFSYYQGRSHDNVFPSVVWPGIIIAIMLLADYSNILKTCRNKSAEFTESLAVYTRLFKFVFLLLVLVSFMLALPFMVRTDQTLLNMQNRNPDAFSQQIDSSFNLIKKAIGNDRNVTLFIYQKDYYYTMLGLPNSSQITSNVDWFTRADYDKALNWLKNTQNKVIIDTRMMNLLKRYNKEEFNQIMSSRFNIQSIGADFYMCTHF